MAFISLVAEHVLFRTLWWCQLLNERLQTSIDTPIHSPIQLPYRILYIDAVYYDTLSTGLY
jgi:hypothetical protein